jgi:CDP-diacylglycerol--glycerol-3-phosphate 3-phosphatidyltransferase
MIDTHARKYFQPAIGVAASGLIKLKISPIKITITSLVIGLGSVLALFTNNLWLAVLLLWLSGLFDALDGTVARETKTTSDLGAFLDITFDRIIELGIIIALVFLQPNLGMMLVILTSMIVMSLTIFLTVSSFAKNNSKKSFYYQAGLAERTEGFIFFSLMIIWVEMRMIIGYIFAVTVLITAIQRFLEGFKMLKQQDV